MSKVEGPPLPSPPPPFIVAEISKNWDSGRACANTPLLSQQFETVIVWNAQRGYKLLNFQFHRFSPGPGLMNETLIAVFERIPSPKE